MKFFFLIFDVQDFFYFSLDVLGIFLMLDFRCYWVDEEMLFLVFLMLFLFNFSSFGFLLGRVVHDDGGVDCDAHEMIV